MAATIVVIPRACTYASPGQSAAVPLALEGDLYGGMHNRRLRVCQDQSAQQPEK